MKTTSIISTLALALPAFAAPAPARDATSSAASCPSISRAEYFSNKNIHYSVSSGTDYRTKVLHKSRTESGIQGCLNACDSTVNCTAVTFVPEDSTNLHGVCYSRTTGRGHATKNPAVLVANRITPASTSVPTAPATTATPSSSSSASISSASSTSSTASAASSIPTFGGLAIRSGSSIHYSSINANGTNFWLQRGTETYTPPNLGLTGQQNATLFVGPSTDIGTLSLLTTVPGGQQVYVDATGLLRFTIAHSANTGVGSTVTGFSVAGTRLQFQDGDFLACPVDGAYEVYAAAAAATAGGNGTAECLGFSFYVAESAGPAAWQYV